ncbi:MAG: hypothetical protein JKY55_06450 [Aliivibrio sp.]|uniref:hypothetical protein n=1 Tax=Aliivibrio sp. TaxID=1872443 RepID=UPI001A4B446A|nr:hypothetical protein [Aliivibrio sp.]
MGQAKHRMEAYANAKAELLQMNSDDARVVAETTIKLFDRFIHPKRYLGGCYYITMLLHHFLTFELGIPTLPIVGYVNDGTDNVMISHAWLEFEGTKSDLTLNLPNPSTQQPSGALLVLDQVLIKGQLSYSYHIEQTESGRAQTELMRRDPNIAGILHHKEQEHQAMLERAADGNLLKAYLDEAPLEFSYAAITKVLR